MNNGVSNDKNWLKKMNKSMGNNHKQHDDVFRTPLFILTTYNIIIIIIFIIAP